MKNKILFLTFGKYNDINNWSGTVFNMHKMWIDYGYEVDVIDDFKENKILKVIFRALNKISNKKYLLDREIVTIKKYARKINKLIKSKRYDFIFSTSTLLVPFLDSDNKIIVYTDATFNGIVDYYESYSNLSKRSMISGNRLEKLALEKADLIIYSSDWARNCAIEKYNISKSKIKVVNFGINMDVKNSIKDVERYVDIRVNNKTINLLFIGVDFKRKGGELALELVDKLNNLGYKAMLHIVGGVPQINKKYNEIVTVYGFLDKNKEKDKIILNKLFIESNFFILPTKAEAFGIVFGEASSYGLPVLTTKTGGVESAIKNGKNGFCLDYDVNEFAKNIIENINSEKYYSLCISSFLEHVNRLNWNICCKKIMEINKNQQEITI